MLKRIYKSAEFSCKFKLLGEYYKYHEEVPRFFIKDLSEIVYNYYDKRRRINFI